MSAEPDPLEEILNPKDNFLLGFVELCRNTEIPESFATWSAIAGVSCALSRRVWIDMATFTIFPNMYICLVGGSGRVRKSTSIGVIERMIRNISPSPNLIAQKITPEALIDAMRIREVQDAKHLLRERNEGFVVVDELATFLNKNSYEAGLAALLIPFFDCKDSFEYKTKGGGSQKLTNVCLGILAGSTADWIANAIPASAVGGGLTSRFIFVLVEKPAPAIPRPQFGKEEKALAEKLQRVLQRITMLQGEVHLTKGAWEFYEEEYLKFRDSEKGTKLLDDKLIGGYANRRFLHLLKLGIIFSAAERPDLMVTKQHLQGALGLLEQTEIALPMLMNMITSSEQGMVTHQVLNLIMVNKRIPRQTLLRLMSMRISARELDGILDTLISSGLVKALHEGIQIFYIFLE